MLAHLEHARDNDVAQVLMDGNDGVDRRDLTREAVGHISAFERAAQESFEPTPGDNH